MKRILQLFIVAVGLISFGNVNAQLEDGTIAPNWTGTDINGNTWTLYDVLDSGKPAIIDVTATWCGPSWSYHQTGALQELYEEYGPNGSDDLMVFWIEGDASTSGADLEGTGGATVGDWTAGTNFPIIDDSSIGVDMGIPSGSGPYPTFYVVCPDRRITNVDVGAIWPTADDFWSIASSVQCQAATQPVDPAFIDIATSGNGCDGIYNAEIDFMNLGTNTLTSATVTANGCANCPVSNTWNGSLATYGITSVSLTNIEVSTLQEVTFDITANGDANIANNIGSQLLFAGDHTTRFQVAIQTDPWPGETTWELRDGSGGVVATGGPYGDGTGAAQDPELVFEDFAVDGDLGCWEFTLFDSYGDGLFATPYGYDDGFASVASVDDQGNTLTFYAYDGSYGMSSDSGNGNVTAVSIDEATALQSSINVYPNPVRDNANISFTLGQVSDVTYEVTDLLGKVVVSESLGTVAAGTFKQNVNMADFEAGVYMVRVNAGGNVATTKITLTK